VISIESEGRSPLRILRHARRISEVVSSVFFFEDGVDRVVVRIVLDGISRPALERRSARPYQTDDRMGTKVSGISRNGAAPSVHEMFPIISNNNSSLHNHLPIRLVGNPANRL
jgi:hypothetical protein